MKNDLKINSTVHGIRGDKFDEQAITRERLASIYYKPGTKLKIESGRHNVKGGNDELYYVRYGTVIQDYGNCILCSFKHSSGYYNEAINKVDIACADIHVSVVKEAI